MISLTTTRRRQRGVTLVEALIAFVVLGLGMLTIGRVQSHLRLGSDIARQRSEAVRLGQADLETLRSFAAVAAASGVASYAAIASAATTIDAESGYASNTGYRLTRDVRPDASTGSKQATVTVRWSDRSGADQQVVLDSVIAGNDPAYSAALTLAPAGTPVKGAHGRSAWIPLGAKDLGNGRSAFKPDAATTTAYVFDNSTGSVVARCTDVTASTATRDLTAADLAGCDARAGYLLSGTVRFSLSTPPDPAQAHDAPLALAITLATAGGTYPFAPSCASEALKTVTYSTAGATRTEAVPIAATPASFGVAAWTDSGDRHVAYHCVVYPLASGQWSGRTTLEASGWAIGTAASELRVCRYSADADGSGAVDANVEHPDHYVAVTTSLANQNFLVVRGPQDCPTGSRVRIDGAAGDVQVDLATAPHQP